MKNKTSLAGAACLSLGAAALVLATLPAVAQNGASSAAPLPAAVPNTGGAVTQIMVSGGQRSLFKIALPPILGPADVSNTVVSTSTRDFVLSSLFQVLDPQSFTANLGAEGLAIDPTSWRNVGAEGVVKGNAVSHGGSVKLELRLYVVSRGADPVLKKTYDVPAGDVKRVVHEFNNEVVKWFTGTPGFFGSQLVFSATTGRGQKGIFQVGAEGEGPTRLEAVSNVAIAPSFGPGGVYYSGGLADGSYQLFKVGNPAAVLKHAGLVFGAAFGGGKMAVTIQQGGTSDIYVGAPDGSGLHKVTNGGLNTHPAFGAGGQLAYASDVSGSPQIMVDGRRVSGRGNYNMAPVWCNDPEGAKIVYMGRDGANWDLFSVSASGDAGSVKRLTQGQGSNTYPACSPDGRTIAFFSSRGGLYLANNEGMNQQRINSAMGESLRWQGN